jgi:hypothetical protein
MEIEFPPFIEEQKKPIGGASTIVSAPHAKRAYREHYGKPFRALF